MKDLSDEARDLNLGDVLLLGDHVQKLSTGGQLRDEGHAVLVVVDLHQPGQPRVVQDVHHLELVHHPGKIGLRSLGIIKVKVRPVLEVFGDR